MHADYTQNIISFCTGYGGLELGLELASLNFRTVGYVEIEAYAQANLVAKIETGKMAAAPIWSDIASFPAAYFSGKVDGFTAGYPCQPFSTAGKQRGPKDPRHLWPAITRSIELIHPRWCYFENVEGHLTLGLKDVMHDLGELGYITTAGLFSASEVGASQRRKRLFILGYSKHYGLHGPEEPGSVEATIQHDKERAIGSGEFTRASSPRELADSCSQRREGPNTQNLCRERWREKGRKLAGLCRTLRWPAGPGPTQHNWEEPRTTKSGVGCTIDGINARNHQLRLLGNGVVPQTAAKAWIELNKELSWQKEIKK